MNHIPHTLRSAAWASGSEGLERTELSLAFVPLTDCAPLVIAKERGFFTRRGLRVSLSREPSWANVRDKLMAGLVDGAQVLGPMPLAASLGIGGMPQPLVTALSLDLNGNAITVSRDLFRRLCEVDPEGMARRPITAAPLRRLIRQEAGTGRPPPVFAIVFPCSSHEYELRYWMAAAGVEPDRDVRIRVVPPPAMVRMLGEGSIDGYCVGEPWNEYAVQQEVGRTLITKHEIWNNAPEKVFAVTREWADRHPNTHRALVAAIVDAARWLDAPEHRMECVHVIAGESYVDAPVDIVKMSMNGTFQYEKGEPVALPDFNVFYRYAATFPWRSHALWFLSQMLRWGHIESPIDVGSVARDVYRSDVYREAVAPLGIPVPTCDEKGEGLHAEPWVLEQATRPISMGPDAFFDGRRFDPRDVAGYLEAFELSALRCRPDDLARLQT